MCGGGNPLDVVSDVIGTGGGDQGLLNVVDEGVQSVGSGLAEVDDFVNEEIPGGYILPAALAVALATGYVDPTLFAAEAGAAGAGTTAGGLTASEMAALTALAPETGTAIGASAAGATGAGLTAAEIAELTLLAPETGTSIGLSGELAPIIGSIEEPLTSGLSFGDGGAYTLPIEAPVIGQPYDVTPLTDPVTGQPFGSIEEPLTGNYMDGFTSVSETGLATLPEEGMLVDLPGTTILGDLGLAGAVETAIPSSGISAMDVLRGVNAAKGLLGSGQEQAVAPATQFKGTRVPQGQVDYSGILSLLQMQSPQRRSLLG
jgi:hypothetical protein